MKENNIEIVPLAGNSYEMSVESANMLLDCIAKSYKIDREKMSCRDNKDGTVDVFFLLPKPEKEIKVDLIISKDSISSITNYD